MDSSIYALKFVVVFSTIYRLPCLFHLHCHVQYSVSASGGNTAVEIIRTYFVILDLEFGRSNILVFNPIRFNTPIVIIFCTTSFKIKFICNLIGTYFL